MTQATNTTLGPPGLLLGWTPIVRSATRRQARAALDDFISREGTT